MTRATTSVLIAMVMVFVLLGGPCLACAAVIAGGGNHNCCHPKKGCQEQPSNSLADCASPAVDLTKVEQASAYFSVNVPIQDQSWNSEVLLPQLDSDHVLSNPVLHSPPDLCLLNSVLNI